MTIVLLHFRDLAVFVVEVAKYKSVSRASLRARRLNLAIDHVAALAFSVSHASSDALYAEGTFLHDSSTANRYVRVEVVAEGLGPYRLPVVEEANDVGTTVRTVPSADASVVDLNVQAFAVVIGGEYRTHRFARCIFAVLAHDRNEPRLDVRELAFPVTLHADPRHGARALKPVLKVQRDVVLGLTGQYTCLTPGALVDIDDHAPAVLSFFPLQCHVVNPRSWYPLERQPMISGLLLTLLGPLHLCPAARILAGRHDGWRSQRRVRFHRERPQGLARLARPGTP